MDASEVRTRVAAIAAAWHETHDYEHAHGLEDALYLDVLRAIAGADAGVDVRAWAAEAVVVAGMGFPRYAA